MAEDQESTASARQFRGSPGPFGGDCRNRSRTARFPWPRPWPGTNKGFELLAQCHGTLERAERRIELLNHVDAAGREHCEPFDDAALSLEEKAQSRTRRRTRGESAIPKADEMDDPGRLF